MKQLPLLCTAVLVTAAMAQEPQLRSEKSDLLDLQRQKSSAEYDKLKKSWLAPIELRGSYTQSSEASSQMDVTTKRASAKLDQNIFRSGGIVYAVRYAQSVERLTSLGIDAGEAKLYEQLYSALLNYRRISLLLRQSHTRLENSDIEIRIRRERYEAGEIDITYLNSAIMNKNSESYNFVTLRGDLHEAKLTLATYTAEDPSSIALPEFTLLDEAAFLDENLELKQAKEQIINAEYLRKTTRSQYLPKVALNAEIGYIDNEHDNSAMTYSGRYDSVGVTASIPLDINMFSTLEEAKLAHLVAQAQHLDKRREQQYAYKKQQNRTQEFRERVEVTKRNIALYEELEEYTKEQVITGYKTELDLLMIQNSLAIQRLEEQIQQLNIQQELIKLHFATLASVKG